MVYCSGSELKQNAQICTSYSRAEPLAYKAINNAAMNPYGSQDTGSEVRACEERRTGGSEEPLRRILY